MIAAQEKFRGTRLYVNNNYNQNLKKPHLIRNLFRIAEVLEDVIPSHMNRTEFRRMLEGMNEIELIEMNCKFLNRIV
jgi:hypothetical protein